MTHEFESDTSKVFYFVEEKDGHCIVTIVTLNKAVDKLVLCKVGQVINNYEACLLRHWIKHNDSKYIKSYN